VAATLFFGGWQGWFLPGYVWFFLKTYLLFLVMVWIRGTLPRLRYDQLMAFAWKVLLPVTLVNLVLAAFVQYSQVMNLLWWPFLLVINIPVILVLYMLYNRFYRAAQRTGAPPLLETALAATQGARA
jgi:NADH-quinone oxidoreductase subunit H